MTVSGVTSSESYTSSGSGSGSLQGQLASLEKQQQQETANKTDDAKTKLEKLALIQQQIAVVEAEIQQQSNSSRQSTSKPAPASKPATGNLLDVRA